MSHQTNTGGPAFPQHETDARGFVTEEPGMTLRDYFAAKVAGTLIALYEGGECSSDDPEIVERERREFADQVAQGAYRYADAMLRARESS